MSIESVTARFAEVINEQYDYLAHSLPMISPSSEILFFYYATGLQDSFVLEELGDVAIRDLESSIISVKGPSDLFTPMELGKLTQPEEVKCLTGHDACEYMNKYYDLHEQLLQQGLEHADNRLLREYLETFAWLVPKSNLRKAYYRIGRPMYQYIASRIGEQPGPVSF